MKPVELRVIGEQKMEDGWGTPSLWESSPSKTRHICRDSTLL